LLSECSNHGLNLLLQRHRIEWFDDVRSQSRSLSRHDILGLVRAVTMTKATLASLVSARTSFSGCKPLIGSMFQWNASSASAGQFVVGDDLIVMIDRGTVARRRRDAEPIDGRAE
jgi:hypothetical protein